MIDIIRIGGHLKANARHKAPHVIFKSIDTKYFDYVRRFLGKKSITLRRRMVGAKSRKREG
jgi:hypothetical protein